MDENNSRPTFQGNWECAECKAPITELPFQPNEGQPLSCKACYMKKRNTQRASRPMVQGNWQCADCGKAITELPFQPSEGQTLRCRDCYMKQRNG
ncbi:MAG: hypothetical protein K9M15_01325 [Candidatus Marinimicrobia bacterium]|nr:hypothetical protein [Candidatus Neomarinimicrobiota bacterium]